VIFKENMEASNGCLNFIKLTFLQLCILKPAELSLLISIPPFVIFLKSAAT